MRYGGDIQLVGAVDTRQTQRRHPSLVRRHARLPIYDAGGAENVPTSMQCGTDAHDGNACDETFPCGVRIKQQTAM